MANRTGDDDPLVGLIVGIVVLVFGFWFFKTVVFHNPEGEKTVEAPVIAADLGSAHLSDLTFAKLQPYGGDSYNVILVDLVYAWEAEGSDNTPNVFFRVTNEDAKLSKADLSLQIMQGDTVYATELLGSVMLEGKKLPYGESNYQVVAKNTAGETTSWVTVTKCHTKEACVKFDPDNQTAVCASYVSKAQYDQRMQEWQNSMVTNNSHTTASTCSHEEAGKCWDEVDEAGYEDGMYDGITGNFEESYFDSLPEEYGDCTGLCEEVYEDAYLEGYEDGKMERTR